TTLRKSGLRSSGASVAISSRASSSDFFGATIIARSRPLVSCIALGHCLWVDSQSTRSGPLARRKLASFRRSIHTDHKCRGSREGHVPGNAHRLLKQRQRGSARSLRFFEGHASASSPRRAVGKLTYRSPRRKPPCRG